MSKPAPNEHVTGTALLQGGRRIEVDEFLFVPDGTSGRQLVELLRRRPAFEALDVLSFDVTRRRI